MATVRTLFDDDGAPRAYKVRWRSSSGAARSRTYPKGHKGEADAWAVKVESDKIADTELDTAGARITVEQYVAQWLALGANREGTALRAAASLAQLREMLGDRRLRSIRQSDVRAWVQARARRVAQRTLKNEYVWVKRVFAAAVADRLLARSPCEGVAVEAPPRRQMVVPEPAGVLALADRLPLAWAILAPLGARTGLRPAELLGLCVEQVDFFRFTVTVDRQMVRGRVVMAPKTASSHRVVPVDEETVKLVAAQLAERPASPVDLFDDRGGEVVATGEVGSLILHRDDGRPLSHTGTAETWARVASRAGLPGVRLHDMRHFFASHLIRHGASVVLVSQLLGHSSPRITAEVYAHEFADRDERARDLIAAVWANDARSLRVLNAVGDGVE